MSKKNCKDMTTNMQHLSIHEKGKKK